MTSPDGIAWTIRSSAANNSWHSVTYGNGLFVAVSYSGTGNRVMTSPDGITWTIRSSAADNDWYSVTYGNGLFVAVSYSGTGNRVMTLSVGENILDPDDDGKISGSQLVKGIIASYHRIKALSDVLRHSIDGIVTYTTTAYVKGATLTFTNGIKGNVRVKFKIDDAGNTHIWAIMTKNGVTPDMGANFGVVQDNNTGAYAEKAQDLAIDLEPGDTIDLWAKKESVEDVFSKEWRFYYTDKVVGDAVAVTGAD